MVKFVEGSTKICGHDGGVCYFSSCSWLDGLGNVVLCGRHRNSNGRCMRKKVAPVHVSVFSKHVLGRS